MKIKRQELLSALNKTAPLSSGRTTLPILNSLKIQSDGTTFTVTATNLDCFASASCECDGPLPSMCVPASAFHGLAKVSLDEITLTPNDTRLKFESNGMAHLAIVNDTEFPAWPNKPVKSIGLSCTDLAECIERVAWAAAKTDEMGRPWTMGVQCDLKPKMMRCAAFNGKQLAVVDKPLISSECLFVMQAAYAPQFIEALKMDGAVFKLSEAHAEVETPRLHLASRLIDFPFANVTPVLQQPQEACGMAPVQQLVNAIDNALMLSGIDPYPACTLTPVDGGCQFAYEGANTYSRHIDMTLPKSFRISMKLFRESLGQMVMDTPRLSLGGQGILLVDSDLTVVTSLMVEKQEAK